MRRRLASLAAAAMVAVVLPVLLAVPALADAPLDDGEQPGSSLGVGLTIAIYVLIPLGLFVVIGGLALLPSALRRERYRPGRAWKHDPLWFAGPEDAADAVAAARPGGTAKGGASADW